MKPTSTMANRKRSKGRAALDRLRIRAHLSGTNMTRESLATATGIKPDSLRPRICELLKSRKIAVVKGRYGRTRCGNKAELLRLA